MTLRSFSFFPFGLVRKKFESYLQEKEQKKMLSLSQHKFKEFSVLGIF